MPVNWPLYEKLLTNGQLADRRDVVIQQAQDAFLNGLKDDPSYQNDAKINGELTPIAASRTSSIACDIKAATGTKLRIGDMIECFGEMWIVVELYVDKVGIFNGVMWLCNNILKFQNHSLETYSRHCVVDDGSYSRRSSDPEAYTMDNTYKVYISIDDATKLLHVDKRLGFGEIYSQDGEKILEVYKITGIDVKSKNFGEGSHLMVITAQRDVYNSASDSLDENLCNVIVGDIDSTPEGVNGICEIVGRDTMRIGTSRAYVANFLTSEGNSVDGIQVQWSMVAPEGIAGEASENEFTITIPLDGRLVGEVIELSAAENTGAFAPTTKKVQVITVG